MYEIEIVLEEYRQLYGVIVPYRLNALDVRIPVTCAALTALVGAIGAASPAIHLVLLFGLPLSMVWLLDSTLNHARSLTDALERIAAIEETVNRWVGATLLLFQSTHPSRGSTRTGVVTIEAVKAAAAVLLGSCLYLSMALDDVRGVFQALYAVFAAVIALVLMYMHWRHQHYRYDPRVVGHAAPTTPTTPSDPAAR